MYRVRMVYATISQIRFPEILIWNLLTLIYHVYICENGRFCQSSPLPISLPPCLAHRPTFFQWVFQDFMTCGMPETIGDTQLYPYIYYTNIVHHPR